MEWISVNDRLPEELEPYLVYTKSLGMFMGYFEIHQSQLYFYDGHDHINLENITHYSELPEPPKTN